MLEYINWGMVSMLGGLGLGYWLRGQNLTTLTADVNLIKADIAKIKTYFTPTTSSLVGVTSVQTTPAPVV